MDLPDVNVLIYAFRTDSVAHRVAYRWLSSVVEGPSAFGISRLALAAVVRICTQPTFQNAPSTLAEAFRFARFLLDQPHCRVIEPGERHWNIFEHLCIEGGVQGARVTDAWYAALAIESGCDWITFDRDYARFPGLRWRVPGADA